ncbi:transforming growth factor beta regulator 1-like [Rhopilema esculentum]|uniref:transforming growth factor beta regulator 1-like n=1 Tax=Rhopilema esculentum TaxID=499914 RepID=UPI0031D04C82|eukprot:gene16586-8011_t
MAHEDVLMSSGGFDPIGTTNLFPSLSEPGHSFPFVAGFSGERANDHPESQDDERDKKFRKKKKHQDHANMESFKSKRKKVSEHYKYKLKKLRRKAKHLVFENAALSDEISYTEQLLVKAKGDRKMLLKKLFQYLPMTESQALQSSAALKSLAANFHGNLPPTVLGPVQPSGQTTTQYTKKKKNNKVNANKKKKDMISKQEKPKRKKPGTAMKRKVQSIPVDEDGMPVFPLVLGGLTVHELGEVIYDRTGFHSERYIWPVGYCSSRLYPSMITPENRVIYTCKILDGGSEPMFEITPEDCKEQPITASTATACHCAVLRRLNKARGKETTNTGSGPEFFGYSHPTVQYLIQSLADVTKLEKYKWVKFELPAKGTVPFRERFTEYGDSTANPNSGTEGSSSGSEG